MAAAVVVIPIQCIVAECVCGRGKELALAELTGDGALGPGWAWEG